MKKSDILIILMLAAALFLRFYRLDELMPFIGDHAWFYLSARDMILSGQIPLVGIESSHTWVHQGSLWTYVLALPLLVSNFNPLSGAYLTAVVVVVTVFLVYKIGTEMFSRRVGIISAVLFSFSPLVVIHSRIPYHTSLIPLFSLLFFFFLYKWIKGDVRFFPLVFLILPILYNLELATMVFWILLIIIFIYGLIKRKTWTRAVLRTKIIFLSILFFLLPLLPMIVYDLKENSGFYQSTAFFRLIKIYLFSKNFTFSFDAVQSVFSSLFLFNQRLVFLAGGFTAFLITISSFFNLLFTARKKKAFSLYLLSLWVIIPLFGIFVSHTASEAYMPMILPAIIFSIAIFINFFLRFYKFATIVIVLFILSTNIFLTIKKNYFMNTSPGYGLSFSKRVLIAKNLVEKSKGNAYNLIGNGPGNEHKNFLLNYEYLTWRLGHPPSKKSEILKFVIEEK